MALLTRGWQGGMRLAAWLTLGGFAWLGLERPARAQTDPASLEYAVKASYLYKFAPFVNWPATSFATPTSPFAICVAGDDPFGPVLDDITRGQQLEDHPIVVRRMETPDPAANCQILFVGRSAAHTTTEMLHAVAGEPVLTVTDRSRGVEGGMIQFVIREGRVRFDIDPAAATANGVSISSKLLDLALRRRD